MQHFKLKTGELTLSNQTILPKKSANFSFHMSLLFFTAFACYFTANAFLQVFYLESLPYTYLLLLLASLLSIYKTILDKSSAECSNIPVENIRVVRFRTSTYSKIVKALFSSCYPTAEFVANDGEVTKIRVKLEKINLIQFKFELVKRDIRIEEY
jgi:hypothetical protein